MRKTVSGLALLAFVIAAPAAHAATGDNLRTIIADRSGTACASIDAAGNHRGVGVGIAFNGTSLLISCYDDNTIVEINPADGSQVAVHTIVGAQFLGALAYDATRGVLWACSNFTNVGTIDLTTNTYTNAFNTLISGVGSAGCFDGLAYDASDDSLFASHDISGTVEHFTVTGTLISSQSNAGKIGSAGNSGIAVGGPKLYLANNGSSEIYEVEKDLSSSTLFAGFPRRLEDLECDNVTFKPEGKAAIWSIDAYDNVLNAWEIPDGACAFGGGNGDPTCHDVVANVTTIWAPNHAMVPVTLSGGSDPDGDEVSIAVDSVWQDEAVDAAGSGSGSTRPDASLLPLAVRAERNGNPNTPGDGRVYHINFSVSDGKGGSCTGTVRICVPHDSRPGATCVDGGALYNSTLP